MKKRNLISVCISFFILLSLSGYSQEIKTLAKFMINDARLNKNDYTELYVKAGGYIVFYVDGNDNFCMANVLPNKNSQSYGRLYSSKHEEVETAEKYKADYFHYKWSYVNTYDDKKGTADVILIKTYKPLGVTFACTIISESLEEAEYKGFMEGTIDFSKF